MPLDIILRSCATLLAVRRALIGACVGSWLTVVGFAWTGAVTFTWARRFRLFLLCALLFAVERLLCSLANWGLYYVNKQLEMELDEQ